MVHGDYRIYNAIRTPHEPRSLPSATQRKRMRDNEMPQLDLTGSLYAAANPYYGPLAKISDEAMEKMLATNIKGVVWLSNLVLPQMAQRRDGVILIIFSVGGLIGSDRRRSGLSRGRGGPVCHGADHCRGRWAPDRGIAPRPGIRRPQ